MSAPNHIFYKANIVPAKSWQRGPDYELVWGIHSTIHMALLPMWGGFELTGWVSDSPPEVQGPRRSGMISEIDASLEYCQYSRKTRILMTPPGLGRSQFLKLFIFSISLQFVMLIYKYIIFDSSSIGFLWQLPPMHRFGNGTIESDSKLGVKKDPVLISCYSDLFPDVPLSESQLPHSYGRSSILLVWSRIILQIKQKPIEALFHTFCKCLFT